MAKTLIGTPLTLTTADTALCEYDITSGITSSYSVYEIHFVNLHSEDSGVSFDFQVNAGGADWDDSPITSTHFQNYQNEADTSNNVAYSSGNDSANNSASFTRLFAGQVNGNDSSASGILTLYDPAGTGYVKNWTGRFSFHNSDPHYATDTSTGGYIRDTDAITNIRFMFSSGDIHAGTIKMFGVS